MITLHTPFPALLPPSFQLILCKIPPKPWIHCTWLLSNIQLPGACGYLLSPCQWHHWLNPWFQIQLSLQYPLSIFLLSLSKLPLLSPQLLFQAHNLASSPLYNFKVILDNVQSSSTWNQRVFLIFHHSSTIFHHYSQVTMPLPSWTPHHAPNNSGPFKLCMVSSLCLKSLFPPSVLLDSYSPLKAQLIGDLLHYSLLTFPSIVHCISLHWLPSPHSHFLIPFYYRTFPIALHWSNIYVCLPQDFVSSLRTRSNTSLYSRVQDKVNLGKCLLNKWRNWWRCEEILKMNEFMHQLTSN